MKKVVYKFGGSSVRDAEAILRVAGLIAQNTDVKIAVISATYNTTNRLEWVFQAFESGDEKEALRRFDVIKDHHLQIFQDLCRFLNLEETTIQLWRKQLIAETSVPYLGFKHELKREQVLDDLYSYGEWVSSWLVTFVLRFFAPSRPSRWLDAREVILTNETAGRAEPLLQAMLQRLQPESWLEEGPVIITQGFIGQTRQGITTTLGREGSDYSATLLARVFDATEVTIWTDVQGIASFDPRLVETVHWHERVSYEEAEFLATGGAKVLFPRTLSPVKQQKIPVVVRSSFQPSLPSTSIGLVPLKTFSMALDHKADQPFSTISLVCHRELDHRELKATYSEILEIDQQGVFYKIKTPSSIALDFSKKFHLDLSKLIS